MSPQIISEYDDVYTDNYVSANVSVLTSQVEAKAGGSRLSNREFVIIHNLGPQTVYYGPSGVTSTSGDPLYMGERIGLPIGGAIAVYLVTAVSTANVRVQELA